MINIFNLQVAIKFVCIITKTEHQCSYIKCMTRQNVIRGLICVAK